MGFSCCLRSRENPRIPIDGHPISRILTSILWFHIQSYRFIPVNPQTDKSGYPQTDTGKAAIYS